MTHNIKKVLKFITIFICLIIIYSAFIEPSLLVVRKYNLNENGNIISSDKINNKNKTSLKVVHITDTQIGYFYSVNRLNKMVARVNSLNPDIVVFTGDLIDSSTKNPDTESITQSLSKIKSSIGKFAVYGNHDYINDLPKYYRQIMKNSGFKLLVNNTQRIEVHDNKFINIIGLDEKLHGEPNIEILEKELHSNDFNLLLLHEPDLIDSVRGNTVDLALAGHTHGGQIRMPFKGALVTPPYGRKYTKDFYNVNNNNLYVSSGLGSTKMPFRILNVPEIIEFNILFD